MRPRLPAVSSSTTICSAAAIGTPMIAPINPKSAPKCQDAREHTHLLWPHTTTRSRNEPTATPSSSRRSGRATVDRTRICVSSASQSPRGRVTRVTTITRNGSRAADPTRPTDHRKRTFTDTPDRRSAAPHHPRQRRSSHASTVIENYERAVRDGPPTLPHQLSPGLPSPRSWSRRGVGLAATASSSR